MTALDFIGVYDPLTRLKSMNFMPDFQWDVCSFATSVTDDKGLHFTPDYTGNTLSDYQLVIIPGGFGSRELTRNASFIKWLQTARTADKIASVCTGALLLGAAGFLTDKEATTHPSAYEQLAPYCKHVSEERICNQGSIITSGGVTAGIDLGLYMVDTIAGNKVRKEIARQMDYRS